MKTKRTTECNFFGNKASDAATEIDKNSNNTFPTRKPVSKLCVGGYPKLTHSLTFH